MPLFVWKECYSVGVAKIDAQHKQLLEILNRLYDAVGESKGSKILVDIFDSFLKYAVEHFDTEETLMRQYGYTNLTAHKAEHDKCKIQVLEYKKILDRGDPVSSVQICHFLVDWLEHHLAGADRAYVEFFKEKGVR